MKTPRVEDFDPKAVPELGSPMDDLPTITATPPLPAVPAGSDDLPLSQAALGKLPSRPTDVSIAKPGSPGAAPPVAETPRNHEATASSSHATVIPRYHDTIVELVRKAVRELGKEAATHRFTVDEKRAIADLIFAYRRQGLRTSENEIARIAVNFVVADHKEHGKESVLDRVLKALNR